MEEIDDPQTPMPESVTAMLDFLDQIGIAWERASLGEGTLLPGLAIEQGRLLIDPGRLEYPGDILHEAGHIAVTPAADRASLGPEGLADAGLEMAAMAWSYAASIHLGLPPELVFHSGGYKGAGASILETLRSGANLGQPLLAWMDLTEWGPGADPERVFPVMSRWLRA